MEKFCVIFLLIFTSASYSQQILWTTLKNDLNETKLIQLNDVTNEVLTFYDQYDYYFDLTGYNKKRFIEEINYGFKDWNWLNKINDLTVFAAKSNMGSGSIILVLCISKNNVNLIIFTNDLLLLENPQSTASYDRDKFANWFKTNLN